MEIFIFPLLLIVILLASLWYHDTHYRLQEPRIEQRITNPLPSIDQAVEGVHPVL